MASLIDSLQLLENIGITQVVVPFILVTTLVYALLTKTGIFGESQTINLVIASMLGLLFISFRQTVTFLLGIVPFFMGFLIVVLLLYMLFSFMGVKPEVIGEAFAGNTILIFVIIMMLIFVALLLPTITPGAFPYSGEGTADGGEATVTSLDTGESTTVATQKTVASEATQTFFNPSVLGAIALLLVAAGTVYFITVERKPAL